MQHKLPPLTTDLIDAFAASAVAWAMWLLGVLCRLPLAHKSRTLHRRVQILERWVECTLYLRAAHKFGPRRRERRFPHAAPPGFRSQDPLRRRRLFFRNANICARKASLHARVAALITALANPEPHVAYFLKRLCRGVRGASLIAIAPPASALAAPPWRDAMLADTS